MTPRDPAAGALGHYRPGGGCAVPSLLIHWCCGAVVAKSSGESIASSTIRAAQDVSDVSTGEPVDSQKALPGPVSTPDATVLSVCICRRSLAEIAFIIFGISRKRVKQSKKT